MRSSTFLSAAALAGLAVASPHPQQLDFAQLSAAPAVQSGPTGVALNQTVTIATSVQVTTTATAAATTTQGPSKRDLEKRTFGLAWDSVEYWNCLFFKVCSSSTTSTTTKAGAPTSNNNGWGSNQGSGNNNNGWGNNQGSGNNDGWGNNNNGGGNQASSSTAASTSSTYHATSSSTSSSSSVALSTSSASSTMQTSTGTSTTSSSTECPTQIEEGTYCGFINPEDPCSPQPGGYGPHVTPDTVEAFQSYAPFQEEALAAPSTVASSAQGVEYTQVFKDLNASVNANSYLGVYTLASYNTTECASICDSTDLCSSFNLYIERDPSVNPSANDSTAATVWGYWCPDPASITNYKCTVWGSSLSAAAAVNYGEYREQFHTVIVASNGYTKANETVPTCTAPISSSTSSAIATSTSTKASKPTSTSTTPSGSNPSWGPAKSCGGKAIDAPKNWMGSKFFPGPFNAQICADYAWSQNEVNKAAAVAKGLHSFTPCKSFNSYYLHKNSVPFGTYCNIYNDEIDISKATYSGGWSGADHYECAQSWSFTLQADNSFGTC